MKKNDSFIHSLKVELEGVGGSGGGGEGEGEDKGEGWLQACNYQWLLPRLELLV